MAQHGSSILIYSYKKIIQINGKLVGGVAASNWSISIRLKDLIHVARSKIYGSYRVPVCMVNRYNLSPRCEFRWPEGVFTGKERLRLLDMGTMVA